MSYDKFISSIDLIAIKSISFILAFNEKKEKSLNSLLNLRKDAKTA